MGGVSDGRSGIAAMRYKNPSTGALQWQKTWFFLQSGVYHVMVNILSPSGSPSAPSIYSVLDQKKTLGPILVNGVALSSTESSFVLPNSTSLWHASVGYTFPPDTPATLNVRRGPRRGDWATIGTSTQPPFTVDLWAAWLQHKPTTLNSPLEYSIYPGLSTYDDFVSKQKGSGAAIQTLENTRNVSAIFDQEGNSLMIVFWNSGSQVAGVVTSPGAAPLTISSNAAVTLIISVGSGALIASDPSQSLSGASIRFVYGSEGKLPTWWSGSGRSKTRNVTFPRGGLAGSAATLPI